MKTYQEKAEEWMKFKASSGVERLMVNAFAAHLDSLPKECEHGAKEEQMGKYCGAHCLCSSQEKPKKIEGIKETHGGYKNSYEQRIASQQGLEQVVGKLNELVKVLNLLIDQK